MSSEWTVYTCVQVTRRREEGRAEALAIAAIQKQTEAVRGGGARGGGGDDESASQALRELAIARPRLWLRLKQEQEQIQQELAAAQPTAAMPPAITPPTPEPEPKGEAGPQGAAKYREADRAVEAMELELMRDALARPKQKAQHMNHTLPPPSPRRVLVHAHARQAHTAAAVLAAHPPVVRGQGSAHLVIAIGSVLRLVLSRFGETGCSRGLLNRPILAWRPVESSLPLPRAMQPDGRLVWQSLV